VPEDTPAPAVEPEVLTALAVACRDHEQVRFRYRDHDGSATRRVVEPHHLVNWGRRWYLVAWDIDRRDWRTFRVDRLQVSGHAGPRFAPRTLPEGGDVATYVARRISSAAWRYSARVTLHAPADAVRARLPAAAGTLEAIDERTCVLITGADELSTIAVWIGVLGVDFTVTDPPELVAHIRALAARYRRATPRAKAPRASGERAP
jgi:predicted DNA-binding transcriptional regulator YafY